MQHPFEGVMGNENNSIQAMPTRRSLLGRIVGAVAALLGSGALASAQAPRRRPTTMAFREEGGFATTYAVGEEGGWVPPPRFATTYAVGEEGGWRLSPAPPIYWATTQALGEEGGGTVTTYALGEEGGVSTTFALGEEGGGATTYAVGEEGGSR